MLLFLKMILRFSLESETRSIKVTCLCQTPKFGRFLYYHDVAARRLQCLQHQAYMDARVSHSLVDLPVMDDDYGDFHWNVHKARILFEMSGRASPSEFSWLGMKHSHFVLGFIHGMIRIPD